uniref:BHLH domain-containing protein n=1 Tax=Panagrolaimus sp. ES5 TaxID=591445 RepID=A0AC34FKS7_9BILA
MVGGGGYGERKKVVLKKRKRIRTEIQKEAANLRERRRMKDLNAAFEALRKLIPLLPYEKKLSRVELLSK